MSKQGDIDYDFIELNRTFHELSKHAQESDEFDLSQAFHVGKPLAWPDLLAWYRVIILSEAGSGKTEEIRHIAEQLNEDGKAAFFIRLEYIKDDFEDSFEVGTYEAFQKWLASEEEGWLLLDSVDEARLRHPGDFHLAINKIGRLIRTAIDRTHIVITSREDGWRAKTDLSHCARRLPFSKSTAKGTKASSPQDDSRTVDHDQSSNSPFKLIALDDLSREQVEKFSTARGVENTAEFMAAVERVDAWPYTTRPEDLQELIEFWKNNGAIGSRLELMRNSINRRLMERDQNRADANPLSPDDAREGAKMIAAATTLTKDWTVRVPDGVANNMGIPVGEILPDWDEKKQSALLSRPIFDEALYGTVRFHHRSVREYLTAEWLTGLLQKQTSRRKVEALLFKNQYGLDVIVPTMRPVLPWLAIFDEKIRDRLREIAPEVIFEGGDPSQFPLEIRCTILNEICEQMASGTCSRSVEEREAVQRFANNDLISDIRSLLSKYAGNSDLVNFLLRMVWCGELKEALPEAKSVALSPSSEKYARMAAFRAVKAVGADSDFVEVCEAFLNEAPALNRALLADLVSETSPSPDSVKWLLDAIEKSKSCERFNVDHLSLAVENFVAATDIRLLPELLSVFDELIGRPPVIERRYCEVSEDFRWLLKAASMAAERLIQERHAAALEAPALGILHKLAKLRSYDTGQLQDIRADFESLVPDWPELNRALFWYDIRRTRKLRDQKQDKRLDEYWRASIFGAFWQFAQDDYEYATNRRKSVEGIGNDGN